MQTYSVSPATIVFCDLSKFSLYDSDKQRTLITSLNAEVTKELFPLLGTYGISPKAICLPTGDGLLCVILDDRDAQLVFSLLVSLRDWTDRITAREHLESECKIRIGVHVGTVSIIPDINRLPNVCSEDINTCRRIMDAARPNQVLFSRKAHETLIGQADGAYSCRPFSKDEPALFDPPTTITVKHGLPLQVRVMKQERRKNPQPRWTVDAPISAPRVIEGATAELDRAEFITEQLKALLESDRQEVAIYEMAQFSSFSIGAVSEELDPNHKMVRPLQRQLELLEQVMRTKRCDVKVVLKARIPTSTKYNDVARRYHKLAAWMEANLEGDRLRPDVAGAANDDEPLRHRLGRRSRQPRSHRTQMPGRRRRPPGGRYDPLQR
jgi:class 3 adenylate cyclase